ncbi:hypothetical protein Fmac_015525 [Flemingia macrophylla]|uniref:Ion transport domain-containing protein n=1 Tax=Flemingia macrophylla TaxID=520843 RepID=A0ABD1MEW8_9FABA
MAHTEKDEIEMLPETLHVVEDSQLRRNVSRILNASISIPITSFQSYEENESLSQKVIAESTNTFPTLDGADEIDWDNRHKYLMRSEKLGMCNDPYCTTCPTYLKKASRKPSTKVDAKFNKNHCFYFVCSYVLGGVMNPHAEVVLQWNKILAIFCLVATFVDPLFVFLFYVKKDGNCIEINRTMRTTLVVLRSINDLIYFSNILLRFRLAYATPGSRVLGHCELVDHPKKIALNYLKHGFIIDLFIVLPIPQIMVLFVLPNYKGQSGDTYAKNLLRAMMLAQHFPRLFRFLQIEQSTKAFILEQALTKDIKNLLIFMLSGHVVGACWYLFGLQRVNQCLVNACYSNSHITGCALLIGCGHAFGEKLDMWKSDINATACLDASSGSFSYGIYEEVVPLTQEVKLINKVVYSVFWGYKQIITLADNLSPSYFVWEVLFVMCIMVLGLCFFAIFIGNIQSLSSDS